MFLRDSFRRNFSEKLDDFSIKISPHIEHNYTYRVISREAPDNLGETPSVFFLLKKLRKEIDGEPLGEIGNHRSNKAN